MHAAAGVLLLALSSTSADTVEMAIVRSNAMPERPGEVAVTTQASSAQLVSGTTASDLRVPLGLAIGVGGRVDVRFDAFYAKLDGHVDKLNVGGEVTGFRLGTRVALYRTAEGVLSTQARVGAWAGVRPKGGLLATFELQLRAAGHTGPLVVEGGLGATLVSLHDVVKKVGVVPIPAADAHAAVALGPVLLGVAALGGLVDEIDAAGVFAGPEVALLVAGKLKLTAFTSLSGQSATVVSLRMDLGR